ncbi:MAG: hypothetical protein ACFFAS_04040 [Promethearchaeota archaeon]
MAIKTTQNKTEKKKVYLRTYPKIIFMYPLFLTSLFFWIIQAALTAVGEPPNTLLGYIWFIVFFINLFVMGFDFPFNNFLILVLGIVITILVLILFILPNIQEPTLIIFNIGSSADYYALMTFVLGFMLGFVLLSARFNYYKVESNEIFHIKGIFSNTANRFPVRSLRIKHQVTDVLEFLLLGAGSITLYPKDDEAIHLYTVVRVKKKMSKIDKLLGELSIIIDNSTQDS